VGGREGSRRRETSVHLIRARLKAPGPRRGSSRAEIKNDPREKSSAGALYNGPTLRQRRAAAFN
jgi:hypothetical protein